MDWFRYIDGYCERLAPGFWDEPLNALSNAAFLVAAGAAASYVNRRDDARREPVVWALTVLVAVIGVGSFLFHTFAQFWSMLADVIPISIFIYAYLGFAIRRYLQAGWIATLVTVAGFIAVSFALDSQVPAHVLNGSVGYLPALFALFAIAAALWRNAHPAAAAMAIAGGVLCVSLVFRTLDNALCATWPIGTHFIWHCLNATLLYLLLRVAADDATRQN